MHPIFSWVKLLHGTRMFIKEVTTRKELRAFIRFPKKLYQGCPHYVPPLDSAEMKALTSHPAKEFCTLKLWMAYENGGKEIVGRIAGIINHKCNELKGQSRVRFGWFDTIDDFTVAKALLSTVEAWGKENGLTELCGPSRFSNMDRQAMLVEGFDQTSSIESDYNYPYYPQFIERFGMEKEVDYVQYKVKVLEVPDKINSLCNLISERSKVHFHKFRNKAEMKRLGKEFFKVVNRSYQHIFNFIPLTDKEINFMVDNNFAVADPELVSVLENEEGKLVGIAFCLPSLSEAFQKANGHLFPFGWIHILRSLKRNDLVDMYLTGVLPEYANSGIHILYHKQLNEVFLKKGFQYAITSQQLETNNAIHIWSKYAAEPFCRRRCYKKDIL